MAPEIIEVWGVTLRGYGLMVALSIPLAFLLVRIESRRVDLRALDDHLVAILVVTALAGWLGGKLAYLAVRPETLGSFKEHPWGALRQGFVLYGAVATGVPAAWFMLRRYRLPVLRSLDVLVFPLAAVHLMGRLGCFLAGCCHGCRSRGLFAVRFDAGMGLNGVDLHPTQLYEAAGVALILAWLWGRLRFRVRFPGQLLLSYLAGSAALRLAVDFFRGDASPMILRWDTAVRAAGDPPNGLTLAQLTSLCVLAAALALLRWGQRRSAGAGAEP